MNMFGQGQRYVLFGVGQLLLDWAIMVVLSGVGVPVPTANLCGRLLAALMGFWLNRRYTFQGHKHGPGGAQLVRFAVFWLLATLLSTLGMSFIDHHAGLHWAWAAKPAVEAVLAVLGFFVSRYWIYR